MKYLKDKIYTKTNNRKYNIRPYEVKNIRERRTTKTLRTQYQVQYETKFRRDQKGNENQRNELEVNLIPK